MFNVLVEGVGPPVLLLHGFPDSVELWNHVTPLLIQAGFKVIAYDQRGYGNSDAPANLTAYRTENIVADAVAILENLGINDKVRLVGHDWGAIIGWLLCLAHPELFERFVAVSVGHPLAYRNAGWRQKLKGWYVLVFQIPVLAEKMIASDNWSALHGMSGSSDERNKRIDLLSRPGRLTAAINWYRANFFKLLFGKFKQNQVATLGIYSSGDQALTENQMTDSQKYMAALWRYVRVEQSSHWIPLDQPEELSRHICDWFRNDPT